MPEIMTPDYFKTLIAQREREIDEAREAEIDILIERVDLELRNLNLPCRVENVTGRYTAETVAQRYRNAGWVCRVDYTTAGFILELSLPSPKTKRRSNTDDPTW